MKKRILSWLLAAAMVLQLLPAVALGAQPELGSVQVIVENTTCTAADTGSWKPGAEPWTGTLFDVTVPLKQDSTMISCLQEAAGTTHSITGADTGYITEIAGLQADGMAGWMVTLNDWFTNVGMGDFTVAAGTLEDGDEIRMCYSLTYNSGLGVSDKDATKTLRSIDMQGGTLAGTFLPTQNSYEIALGQGITSGTLTLLPVASNRAFQVRTYKGETYSTQEKGFKRGTPIPVTVGDVLSVVVGDPQWGSMANGTYGCNAEKVPAQVYTFEIVEEAAGQAPTVESFFTALEGVATVTLTDPYPMAVSQDGTCLVSTNGSVTGGSESGLIFQFLKDAELHLNFKTSSEERFDFLRVKQNGDILNGAYNEKANYSGIMTDFVPYSLLAHKGDKVEVHFYKDYSSDKGQDCAWIKDITAVLPNAVTFHANDGTETVKEQGIFGTGNLEANTFTREGYRFEGWADRADGPVVLADGAEITLEANRDLYAVWTAVWKVTFPNMPRGAEIRVLDGENQVCAPLEDGSWLLSDGTYTYSASCFGYEPVTGVSITVAGAPLPVAETLTAKPVYDVTFTVAPPEAQETVTVTNEEGTVMEPTAPGAYALPAGTYSYEIKAKDYATVRDTLLVEAQPVEISVTMEVFLVWDGTVAPEAPALADGFYQIALGQELAWFARQVNAGQNISAVLVKDIQLNAPETPTANVWTPIGTASHPFAGTLNGGGHTIFGLHIPEGSRVGLAGCHAGTITNLTIADSSVTGTENVGAVAGENTGTITGTAVKNTAVTGKSNVGGIAGYNNEGTVEACSNEDGSVRQNVPQDKGVGGIVGDNLGTVSLCFNTSHLVREHTDTISAYFGGIVGNNRGLVESCYNLGTVDETYKTGGITGNALSGSAVRVVNCYNAGTVLKSRGFAIQGNNYANTENCFYLDTCGVTDSKAESKTADELKAAAPLLGGAFQENPEGFPMLKWQDPNATYSITLRVTPAQAQVTLTLKGEPLEPTEAQDGVYTYRGLQPGDYSYSISYAEGDCEPQAGVLPISKADASLTVELAVRHYAVTLTLEPADCLLTVRQGETVLEGQTADGQAVYSLPNGTYDYTCEKFGFTPLTGSFTVDHGPVEQALTMERSPSSRITFTLTPPEAALTVTHPQGGLQAPEAEGHYLLVDGTYTVTAVLPGYVTLTRSLEVAGENQTVALTLEPIRPWEGGVASAFAGGSGTRADPYRISTGDELSYLSQLLQGSEYDTYKSASYVLTNDIDLGGTVAFRPVGTGFSSSFRGDFDGNGYAIRNLYVEAEKYAGLFGHVSGCSVHDLTLTDPVVTASGTHAGALVGYDTADDSTYTNLSVAGAIVMADAFAGGLIGEADTCVLTRCAVQADVAALNTSAAKCGGVAGSVSDCTLSQVYVRGTVTASGDGTGGIAGFYDDDYSYRSDFKYMYVDVIVAGGADYGPLTGTGYCRTSNVTNVYYNSDLDCTGTGTPTETADAEAVTTQTLRSSAILTGLNAGGDAYVFASDDRILYNDGLPTLSGLYAPGAEKIVLAEAQALAWEENILTWTPVDRAVSYLVILFKDGTELTRLEVQEARADFTADIGLAGSGSYTAQVQALGNGLEISNGPLSALSPVYEAVVTGAAVTFTVTCPGDNLFAQGDPVITVTVGGQEIPFTSGAEKFLPTGVYPYTITAATFEIITGTLTVEAAPVHVEHRMVYDPVWDGKTTAEPRNVDGVYEIRNGYELAWFRDQVNLAAAGGTSSSLSAVLTADIDLGNHPWAPIYPPEPNSYGGVSTSSTNGYTGTFDGAGHRIGGLFIDVTAPANGLFGYVYDRGVIKNLTVAGSVRGGQYASGIVAILGGGRMENCVNEATVEAVDANYAGGVTSYMTNYTSKAALVTDCLNRGSVTGRSYVGGVVGNASSGVGVTRCGNLGRVLGQETVGGVVGSSSLPISASCNRGSVTGTKGRVGGIAGFVNKAITNCYNTAVITGTGKASYGVGGLAGQLHSDYGGSAEGSFNLGLVTDLSEAGFGGALAGTKGRENVGLRNCWYLEGSAAAPAGQDFTQGDEAAAASADQFRTLAMAGLLGGEFAALEGSQHPVLSWENPEAKSVLVFQTSPEGVTVTVTDAEGRTVAPSQEAGVWVLADGTYTYRAQKEDFTEASGTVTVEKNSRKILVVLRELTYAVTLEVTPAEAEIHIYNAQGQEMEAGDTGYSLPNGTYTYTVRSFGYVGREGEFTVNRAEVTLPPVTLVQAPRHQVTLNVTYEADIPENPSVSILWQGQKVADTLVSSLPEGEYTYLIAANGYFNSRGSFTVTGEDLRLDVAMALRTTWDGTAAEPALLDTVYQITCANELAWFAQQVNAGQTGLNAVLLADIYMNDELSSNTWTSMGTYDNRYTGTFDGGGRSIRGLNNPLFGIVGEGGLVENVTLYGTIQGTSNVGAVSGSCYGSIRGCVSYADITAEMQRVGGIVGLLYTGGTIENCVNHGTVVSTYTGNEFQDYSVVNLGGIVGLTYGSVTGSYNTGAVKALKKNYGGTGGIAGALEANAVVSDCYNTGRITGDHRAAGIAGIANKTGNRVENCYNVGTVHCTGSTNNPFCAAVVGTVANQDGLDVGTAVNCWYLEGSYRYVYNSDTIRTSGIGYGTDTTVSCTEEEMKQDAMVRKLGEAFHVDDPATLNGGYPVLAWQGGRAPEATEDEKAVAADRLALTVTPTLVKEAMTLELARLGEKGSTVTWETSNEAVITAEGLVTLPAAGTETVTLTATVSRGEARETREFEITVQSRAVTDQQELDALAEALGTVILRPVYGEDTNVNDCLRALVEAAQTDLDRSLVEIQVSSVGTNSNNNDPVAHIASDGTITYFYEDPATCALWGATVRDLEFTLTYREAAATVAAMARIPWNTDLVLEQMEHIANALTFDVIRGENTQADSVLSDLVLPVTLENYGWALISWASDNGAIAVRPGSEPLEAGVGKVYPRAQAQSVTLTARITFNKTGDGEAPITLDKTFHLTVPDRVPEYQDEMENALAAYTLSSLRDAITGLPIDPMAVTGDIQLPRPRDLGITDGSLYTITLTPAEDTVTVNGYRAVVYRPLPQEEARDVALTVTITHRASGDRVSKSLGTVRVLPLVQKELDRELALMEQVKAQFFRGIRGDNTDPMKITGNLHAFREAYLEDGELVWVYDIAHDTDRGITPVSIPREGYDESYNLFHSSQPAVIHHENLLVYPQAFNREVTVTACLSSQTYGRYAERYPENETFAALTDQPVTVTVRVLGTDEAQVAANSLEEQIAQLGDVTPETGSTLQTIREACDALSPELRAGIRNLEALEQAEAACAAALREAARNGLEAAEAAAAQAEAAAREAARYEELLRDDPEAQNVRAQAAAAQAAAEKAREAAEATQKAAEALHTAIETNKLGDAQTAAQTIREKAAGAQTQNDLARTAAEAAQREGTVLVAENSAEAAAQRAREAQAAAQRAREAAEAAEASTARDQESARKAREAAGRAAELAERAREAADQADLSLETTRSAAQAGDLTAARAASEAAGRAAEAAEGYSRSAEYEAQLAELLAENQRLTQEAEEARKAREAARLAAQKAEALLTLAQEPCEGPHAGACRKLLDEAREKISQAETAEEVEALLAQALKDCREAASCPSEKFTDVKPDQWYHESVDYVVKNNYMQGMSDTEFGVSSTLTRAQLVTILYRAAGSPAVEGLANPFEDVKAGTWYTEAVIWASHAGIVSGVTAGRFAPMRKITREQLVTILYRSSGAKAQKSDFKEFADGSQVSAYANEAMAWAVAEGILSGIRQDGALYLKPAGNTTRAQCAAIMMRYLESR